jgi:hypothetical protein
VVATRFAAQLVQHRGCQRLRQWTPIDNGEQPTLDGDPADEDSSPSIAEANPRPRTRSDNSALPGRRAGLEPEHFVLAGTWGADAFDGQFDVVALLRVRGEAGEVEVGAGERVRLVGIGDLGGPSPP